MQELRAAGAVTFSDEFRETAARQAAIEQAIQRRDARRHHVGKAGNTRPARVRKAFREQLAQFDDFGLHNLESSRGAKDTRAHSM